MFSMWMSRLPKEKFVTLLIRENKKRLFPLATYQILKTFYYRFLCHAKFLYKEKRTAH